MMPLPLKIIFSLVHRCRKKGRQKCITWRVRRVHQFGIEWDVIHAVGSSPCFLSVHQKEKKILREGSSPSDMLCIHIIREWKEYYYGISAKLVQLFIIVCIFPWKKKLWQQNLFFSTTLLNIDRADRKECIFSQDAPDLLEGATRKNKFSWEWYDWDIFFRETKKIRAKEWKYNAGSWIFFPEDLRQHEGVSKNPF